MVTHISASVATLTWMSIEWIKIWQPECFRRSDGFHSWPGRHYARVRFRGSHWGAGNRLCIRCYLLVLLPPCSRPVLVTTIHWTSLAFTVLAASSAPCWPACSQPALSEAAAARSQHRQSSGHSAEGSRQRCCGVHADCDLHTPEDRRRHRGTASPGRSGESRPRFVTAQRIGIQPVKRHLPSIPGPPRAGSVACRIGRAAQANRSWDQRCSISPRGFCERAAMNRHIEISGSVTLEAYATNVAVGDESA